MPSCEQWIISETVNEWLITAMCMRKVSLQLGKQWIILCCTLGWALSLSPTKHTDFLLHAVKQISSSGCHNPMLLALFLDTTVNQKLILQPENAVEGILVLCFFFLHFWALRSSWYWRHKEKRRTKDFFLWAEPQSHLMLGDCLLNCY